MTRLSLSDKFFAVASLSAKACRCSQADVATLAKMAVLLVSLGMKLSVINARVTENKFWDA